MAWHGCYCSVVSLLLQFGGGCGHGMVGMAITWLLWLQHGGHGMVAVATTWLLWLQYGCCGYHMVAVAVIWLLQP